MSLRWHEIAETRHRILNPLLDAQLDLLGEIVAPGPATRQLDLACGKGEMLCRWAARYGLSGIGVDLSSVFLQAARARAAQLGVTKRVRFVEGRAESFAAEPASHELVSCIGATWIGGGLRGTLDLMRPALAPGGLLLVGEVFWNEPPPPEVARRLAEGAPETFATLPGTLDRFEGAGLELVEMVLATDEGWERYEAPKWGALADHLAAHPDDPEADGLRAWLAASRREYLEVGRRYLGWGVFVLRPRA